MSEFLKSKNGSLIVIVGFLIFIYFISRSWFQVGFYAFSMLIIIITGHFVDKRNRNPKYIHFNIFPKKFQISKNSTFQQIILSIAGCYQIIN